jgi:hypothetical protein
MSKEKPADRYVRLFRRLLDAAEKIHKHGSRNICMPRYLVIVCMSTAWARWEERNVIKTV